MPRPFEGVSIPFEREGVCKVTKKLLLCFNSLRAGRCMQRHRRGIYMDKIVSIPFEREGVCKETIQKTCLSLKV